MRNVWEKATADTLKYFFCILMKKLKEKKNIKKRQPVSGDKYHPEITRKQQVLTATL
jgi:hypothetical protein